MTTTSKLYKYFAKYSAFALAIPLFMALISLVPATAHAQYGGYYSDYDYTNPYGSHIGNRYTYNSYPAPVYHPPVIIQQPVYVQPSPVYVQPSPVYVAPTVVYQQPVYQTYPAYYSPINVSCSANTTYTSVGSTVYWTAYATGGNGYYNYSWSGSEYTSGNSQSIGVVYSTPGNKLANVTVYSNSQTVTAYCSNSVNVNGPYYTTYPVVSPTIVGQPVYQPTYVQPTATQPANNTVNKTVYKTVYKTTPAKATVAADPVTTASPLNNAAMSANSYFSLASVPWGSVAVLMILVLFCTVMYLLFNRQKI